MNFSDPDVMKSKALEITERLKSISNHDRLSILCLLTKGERSVSDIESTLKIVQPTLSQQLGVLREMGMVTTRREGKRIYYSITDSKTLFLLQTLYMLYCPPERVDEC